MTHWLPMSTAPTRGEVVLLAYRVNGSWPTHMGVGSRIPSRIAESGSVWYIQQVGTLEDSETLGWIPIPPLPDGPVTPT